VVDVLVILDGASEPLGVAPTSLERAHTPVLDELAGEGVVGSLQTIPPGLPVGSETAIPGLLGWAPDGPVDRGAVEAAAYGIEVGDGERAWRVDRRDRTDAAATARMLAERVPRHRVYHLAGHRMLVLGLGSQPTLGSDLLVWPGGLIPPHVLGQDTVVIGARGAAIGIGRLMGARTIVPPGATGRPGSALSAKATAALAAIGDRTVRRVVLHVGAPDEAAHDRDAGAKVATIEAADALLLAPLADVLRTCGGTLRVCPDHGCDPVTGEHDDTPVPCLDWPAAHASGGRLTERTAAGQSAGQAVAA
jgi:2,3-bisphosphoglycerate-independent phosphoglycerate mutase